MEVATTHAVIDQVTVYASGARVRRTTTINAPVPPRLHIPSLPLAVIDDTVRVEVAGPAVATGVRVAVDAPAAGDAAAEDPPELRAAQQEVALAEAEIERIGGALEHLANAPIVEPDPTDEAPPAWTAVVSARRTVVALRAEREQALREQLAAARRTLDDARRALEAIADRDRRLGTARPAKLHELRKHLEIDLEAGALAPITIHVEYQVAAARWVPSYVARLDGDRAIVELRAVVAQDSGEDWTGIPLRLSTAEPARFAVLPELAAQRIGRRQQEPAPAGFRAPPTGADALYADYDRMRSPGPPRQARPRPITSSTVISDALYVGEAPTLGAKGGFAEEVWDESSSRAKEAFHTPPSGRPALPAMAPRAFAGSAREASAPAEMPRRSKTAVLAKKMRTEGEAGAAVPEPVADATVPRLDYGNLRMASPSSRARGTLIPVDPDRNAGLADSEAGAARARISALPLPPGCSDDWPHTYDYAFASDGAVDVKADGAWHSVAVTSGDSTAKLHHVTVPREQADVFRVAAIGNPFAGPLLPGPIDIYDRGKFLVTSEVDYTPPGATVDIGLGVDPSVKVARNTVFREEAAGMLRGALKLHHAITIDVENLSGRSIEIEVRERVPVTREGDDEVEVTLGRVEPAWERWTPDAEAPRERRLRGGHRWRLAVPAGQMKTVRAAYEVKIATKLELVGGNRRES